MKKRYDVRRWVGGLPMRFTDQQEAFDLAKKVAEQDRYGEALMDQLVWEGTEIISTHTVAVKADGSFRSIN